MADEFKDWHKEKIWSWPADELGSHHLCSSEHINQVYPPCGGVAFAFIADTKWILLVLKWKSFKSHSCMSSGLSSDCVGDKKGTRTSHCGEMFNTKMQAAVGRGCIKDCFSLFLIPILLLLVTPALSIHMESIESHSEFSCEPIRLRMCQDLPYNTTFMPNLLNHYDQQTAALAMEVSCCFLF